MICKNCGHGLINIDGRWFHSGTDQLGQKYTQKLCWQEDCECLEPEPDDAEKASVPCTPENPCCDRRGEYNGLGSGPLKFVCPKHCACHD